MTTNIPMFGSFDAMVRACKPVSIHGDVYFDLAVQLAAGGSNPVVTVRVPEYLCPHPPSSGDRVRLIFLMQQVSEMAFLT